MWFYESLTFPFLLVGSKALVSQLLVLGAFAAIVGIGVDADAATGHKETGNLDIFGIHEVDEVFEDDVNAVLMEVAMVAETMEIEFQALAFNHALVGNVTDAEFGEVGLSCNRTKGCELGTVETHPIVVVGVLVLESFEDAGVVVVLVLGWVTHVLETRLIAVTYE